MIPSLKLFTRAIMLSLTTASSYLMVSCTWEKIAEGERAVIEQPEEFVDVKDGKFIRGKDTLQITSNDEPWGRIITFDLSVEQVGVGKRNVFSDAKYVEESEKNIRYQYNLEIVGDTGIVGKETIDFTYWFTGDHWAVKESLSLRDSSYASAFTVDVSGTFSR